MGADNVSCCTERRQKDPKSAFAHVAAVSTAPFSSQIRMKMAETGGFLAYSAESKAIGPRLAVLFHLRQGTLSQLRLDIVVSHLIL